MKTKKYSAHIWIPVFISFAVLTISCQPPKPRVFPPKQIPPLETRIYSSPGLDWSSYKRIQLDLKERGTPDESRNQILEEFLLTEASLLLTRKGYEVVDTGAAAILRVYFGTTEKKTETTEMKSIAYSALSSYSPYITSLSLIAGLWQSASVSTATWMSHSTDFYYEAEISVELYDVTTNKQLWRGDVFLETDSRDIRVGSNYMFRELLWSFPAISYPEVKVPKAEESEFESLWEKFLVNREFFIPGSRHHISFAFKEVMADESEAEAVFRTTRKYELLKLSIRPWEVLENTKAYSEAFLEWYEQDGSQLVSSRTKEFFHGAFELVPAYIDMLQTCPVAYVDSSEKIHLVWEYVVNNSTRYLHLIALPQQSPYVFQSGLTRYYKTKYHVAVLEETGRDEYLILIDLAQKQRETILGQIDSIQE